MSQSLTGFFTDRPNDFLTIRRGMDALERELKRDSAYLPPQALEIRSRVTELLGLIGTSTRRGAEPQRNQKDVAVTLAGRFVTVNEAAKVLSKSGEAVRKDCRRGRLFAEKSGKSWRITADSVERLRKGAA